jgi:hypothetical protein
MKGKFSKGFNYLFVFQFNLNLPVVLPFMNVYFSNTCEKGGRLPDTRCGSQIIAFFYFLFSRWEKAKEKKKKKLQS